MKTISTQNAAFTERIKPTTTENAAFTERIKRLRSLLGTMRDVIKETLISAATINQIKNGKTRVTAKTLALLDAAEIRMDITEPIHTPRSNPATNHGRAKSAPVVTWAKTAILDNDFGEIVNQSDEFYSTDCKYDNCIWVKIEGNSMADEYQAGDYVLCLPGVEAQNGDLVIVKAEKVGVKFKLFSQPAQDGPIKLRSFNPEYDPITIQPEDVKWVYPIHSMLRILRFE